MKKLSSYEMYKQLIKKGFLVSVMVTEEDGATEITPYIESDNKILKYYTINKIEINCYNTLCCTMYVD